MPRIVVILLSVLAACDVGALPGHEGGGDDTARTDSGASVGGDGGSNCEPISASPPQGHHNPGQTCIVAGCHLVGNTGAGAPAWAYAGTLYKDAQGTQPLAGATIIIKLGTMEKKVISADNGNIFMQAGVGGLDPPTNTNTANTRASGCPDSAMMVGALVQGGGSCNNCHKIGGTTQPMHLP